MRRTLLLSVALLALMPVMAHAVDATKAAPAPAAPAVTKPISSVTTGTADAAVQGTFSETQKAAIEAIIKEYLTKKEPEVVYNAAMEYEKRQMDEAAAKASTALTADHDKVFNDPNSPIGGNPNGDVTMVEFFDYACGYCKMAEPSVEKLIKEDKGIKLIYKDYPILGEPSEKAAKAALAAARQGKYIPFHDYLFAKAQVPHGNAPAETTDKVLMDAAKEVGLDIAKLKKDMDDPAITKLVDANVALGQDIGARGTPTFVIGDKVYPGALPYEQLKSALNDARTSSKDATKK